MRIVLVWCLLLAAALPGLAHFDFTFDTNSTIFDDPYGRLNQRTVSHYFNNGDMRYLFRSIRDTPAPDALEQQIDTIGGLITYRTLPVALLAYWNGNSSWNYASSDVTAALNAVGMAFSTLIERDSTGSIVRSYSLARMTSNLSAGIDWNVSAEADDQSKAHWIHMDATVPIPSTSSHFDLEIVWFLTSESGIIDFGNTNLSPRRLECIIRVTNYIYASPGNSLSLRVLASYPTVSYSASKGFVCSGSGISLTSVTINAHGQILDQPGSITGTNVSVSISDWQPSPGLRNAVYNSEVGCYLNTKYGLNWDTSVADITFPTDATNLLFSSSLGYSSPIVPPATPDPEPVSIPNHFPGPHSNASFNSFGLLYCIISVVLLASLL